MKFLKENKGIIISFIIGVIIASSITVYAYSYFASDISYTKPGTQTAISVETALNELYQKNKHLEFDLYCGSDYSRDYPIGRFESELYSSVNIKINPITYRDDYTKNTLPAPTNNFEAYNSTAGVYYRTSKELGYTLVTSEITLNNVSYIDILALGWATTSYAQAHIEIY